MFSQKKTQKKLLQSKNLKSRAKSNLVLTIDFTFYKYHNTKGFAKRYFYSKQNDLIQFKGMLEFYVTEENKPNN